MDRTPIAAATSAWQTRAPWAGIAFTVLFVGAFLAMGETPSYDDRQGWLDYHDDSGNRWQQILAAYLAILAAFAFLWFGIAVIARLGGNRGGGDVLTGVARAATTLFTGFVVVAYIAAITVSAAVEIGEAPVPESADFAIVFDQFGFGLLPVGACLAAVVVVSVSELARENGAWPAWLVWAGFIFGALLAPRAALLPTGPHPALDAHDQHHAARPATRPGPRGESDAHHLTGRAACR